MFTKLTSAVAVMAIFVVMAVFAGSAFAIDLQLNDDWRASVVNGLVLKSGNSNSQFSGGVFYGPIALIKSESGKNVLGLGGLIGNLKSDENGVIKGAIGITAVTAFDNMVQASVVADPTDFKWLDADSYMLAVTVQPIEAMKAVGSGLLSLLPIGMIGMH